MRISSVEELVKRGELKKYDELIFYFKEAQYKYIVYENFLGGDCGDNNAMIFVVLNLNKTTVANLYYGYESHFGEWPMCNDDDYPALTRLAMYLFIKTGQLFAQERAPAEERIFIKELHASVSASTVVEALRNFCPSIFELKDK